MPQITIEQHAQRAPGIIRLIFVLGVIAAGPFVAIVFDFARRMEPRSSVEGLPKSAVVFTGQFDRVFKGLELMRRRRVTDLLISGANPGAGIWEGQFASQFSLDHDLQEALASGRLTLGEQAQNTLENAAETANWYKRRRLSGPLLLITSCSHMPRASLALERSLPTVDIVRMCLPSAEKQAAPEVVKTEFLKFVATLIVPRPREINAFKGG